MSSNDNNDDLFSSFLDDFFAESDEHLSIVRRNLLALEPCLPTGQIPRSIIDELFRSFHSIKGLSGMVGIKESEQLAHEMESYLRGLRDQQVRLSSQGVDALMSGTKMLEQVIAMRRSEAAPPDITATLTQLAALIPCFETQSAPQVKPPVQSPVIAANSDVQLKLKPEERELLQAAIEEGNQLWHFEFIPGADKAERGINVNTIRERLQNNGEIIYAAPRILSSGKIIFDFVIASPLDESAFADWENDGLTWQPWSLPEEPPAPEPPPQAPEPHIPSPTSIVASANVVRVDLSKLDDLMRMVGDLVISRARLEDNLAHLAEVLPAAQVRPLRETNLALERQIRALREGVMRVRLVPVGEVFARMQFVVRDIARETNQQVSLQLEGQETEIDKFVVERMIDPLLHLVRNAVSHGLESTDERIAKGKPPESKLALRATTSGEMVIIEIEDDGRGVNIEKIAQRAKAMNLIDEHTVLDWATVLDIICSPGFSTREQADLTSGRGVGMAVVKNTVLELGGYLSLHSEIDQGTRFRIELPLTLAIADALIVSVCDQRFAVPHSCIREVLEVKPSDVTVLQNNQVVAYRDSVLPLVYLSQLFRLKKAEAQGCNSAVLYAIVVGTGLDAVGILVDRVLEQREIVIRALTDPLVQVPGISGATELGDGRAVLILDTAQLRKVNKDRVKANYLGF